MMLDAGIPTDAPEHRGRSRPSRGQDKITPRLSPDVIEKFRATGKGWQSRINEALRKGADGRHKHDQSATR